MKLAEVIKLAKETPIKVDDALDLPLGIIEDTEDGLGICTMDSNDLRSCASIGEIATASLLVHCVNKYPRCLDRILHVTSKLQNLIALCGLDPDDFKDIIDPLIEVWEEGQEVEGI